MITLERGFVVEAAGAGAASSTSRSRSSTSCSRGWSIQFRLPAILSRAAFGSYSLVNSLVSLVNNVLVTGTIQAVSQVRGAGARARRGASSRPACACTCGSACRSRSLLHRRGAARRVGAPRHVEDRAAHARGPDRRRLLVLRGVRRHRERPAPVPQAGRARHHVRDAARRGPARHGDGRARRGRRDRRLGRRGRRRSCASRSSWVGLPGKIADGGSPAGEADDQVLRRRRDLPRAVQRADVRRHLADQAADDRVLRGARDRARRRGRSASCRGRRALAGYHPDPSVLADVQIGYYAAVQNLARLSYQAIIAATFVVFPLVSRSTFTEDKETTRRYVEVTIALLADVRDGDRGRDGGEPGRRARPGLRARLRAARRPGARAARARQRRVLGVRDRRHDPERRRPHARRDHRPRRSRSASPPSATTSRSRWPPTAATCSRSPRR